MDPVDAMFAAHVTPVLAAAGFVGAGRQRRLVAPNGDQAIVHHRSRTAAEQGHAAFYVTGSLVPMTQADWARRDEPPRSRSRRPGPEYELVRIRILPPPEHWYGIGSPYSDARWGFPLAAPDACAAALAGMLETDVVPRLRRLLDRHELLAAIRDPAQRDVRGDMSPLVTNEIVLLLDEPDSPELHRLLDQLAAEAPDSPFLAWARERLTRAG